ncbi:metal ABC transporter permease [Arachnia propionica]|uniref:Metal ABC transporter permease n=1 Tax=Arachnia propionica TaxID=1750 RepID=A0A3P1WX24_9ACTN|nr:metal ABC transporter permease [Arachnia propionica]RRD50586.1 metal ABC transporter permease [Arachnia propionica]
MTIFSHAFMQRAIIAAVLSGLVAPAIGMYIVQRRLSLLGDGLGHVAIMGVGLAMLTGWAPLPMAVITCVIAAVIVELLRQSGKASGDLGLAVLFYGGIASGVMMAGIAGKGPAGLSAYLFGSLTTVSQDDLVVIAVLGVVILLFALGLWPRLFAICADEDFARVLGLRVRLLNLLIVVVAAVTVTISMRTVGLLLISALMVIPVAASQQLFVGFRSALLGAMGIGLAAAMIGTVGSYHLDTATGATIVVTAILLLGLATVLGTVIQRRRRHVPFAPDHGQGEHIRADHPPTGRPASGRVSVIQHGDHLDEIVGVHRHARHGDHYDEH